jgi:mono/diheme cytochrome c family protein
MVRSWLWFTAAAICMAGCGNDLGDPLDVDGGVDEPPSDRDMLPCDVQTFLADHCQSCHGAQPVNGAPISLVTYRDLTSKNANGVMIAQRAVTRLQSTTTPMPPPPAPTATATDISAFEAWVTAGAPPGDCTAAPGPFDGPPVCTSGTMWTGGDHESPLMHPGNACIACHAQRRSRGGDDDAPRFTIAGTVYPTGHEPNDCNGAPSATVEVTDAKGAVTSLPVNAAGNFFTSVAIEAPFHLAVVANGKRRAMGASPPTGDCNSCHTQDGANMAPGRIALP